jgi:hypothetical protein
LVAEEPTGDHRQDQAQRSYYGGREITIHVRDIGAIFTGAFIAGINAGVILAVVMGWH